MKVMKFMCGLACGIAGTLLYQRYSKSIVNEMDCLVDKTVKKVNKELDEMM